MVDPNTHIHVKTAPSTLPTGNASPDECCVAVSCRGVGWKRLNHHTSNTNASQDHKPPPMSWTITTTITTTTTIFSFLSTMIEEPHANKPMRRDRNNVALSQPTFTQSKLLN
eukprot:gnl/Chilomastix_caulleri/3774.p1 GENE.gnl/Chilomastix_caulleri/3774~~gnl/Chilomastix_caulleri/3774.p1  ORF type:complete len:112 (+),score=18.12 gnl/Chilomastix_caulleri/3774:58-393(+)